MSFFDDIDTAHASVPLEVKAQKALNDTLYVLNSSVGSLNTAISSISGHADLLNVSSAVTTSGASIVSAINAKAAAAVYTTGTATKFTANPAAVTSALLFPANANRKGFTIYNNSTNSLYICIENPATAANLIDFCGSNAGPTSVIKWLGPVVYTGAIYVIRNAGTGGVTGWEFT